MKKTLKNLSTVALVLTFLLVGCTSDPTTTNDETVAKSKLTNMEADWIEIGYVKDGMPYITFDTKKALATLSENMRKIANIEANYTTVYVASIGDTYNLLFEGDTYRTSFYVTTVASQAKLEATTSTTALVAARKITCTTSDCSHEPEGCAVKYDNGNTGLPYCSPCANGGKCTKTDISQADVGVVAQGVF